jgi:hypothetical protein
MPCRFEIDAAPPSGPERPNLLCLGGLCLLRRLYDRVRLHYLVLKCANRLLEKVNRPLLTLGKICACFLSFLSLLRVPRLLASWFAAVLRTGAFVTRGL